MRGRLGAVGWKLLVIDWGCGGVVFKSMELTQLNQIKEVLNPILRVAKRPFKCIPTSPNENFALPCLLPSTSLTPQACIVSIVREHGRLYFLAMNCSVSTTSSSRPSPTRYLGVSFSRMTVTRAIDMAKTSAPLANHT
jgi:hypothetical protein